MHFPHGYFSSFSDNIIININKDDNKIYHLCSTDHGSSGEPLLNLYTLKVIAIHQGHGYLDKDIFKEIFIKQPIFTFNRDNKILCNIGTNIKKPIFNFNNKENIIVLTLEIKSYDTDTKIYFL